MRILLYIDECDRICVSCFNALLSRAATFSFLLIVLSVFVGDLRFCAIQLIDAKARIKTVFTFLIILFYQF